MDSAVRLQVITTQHRDPYPCIKRSSRSKACGIWNRIAVYDYALLSYKHEPTGRNKTYCNGASYDYSCKNTKF